MREGGEKAGAGGSSALSAVSKDFSSPNRKPQVKVSYCGDIKYHWAVKTASLAFDGMQPCAMPAGSHSKAVYMQL